MPVGKNSISRVADKSATGQQKKPSSRKSSAKNTVCAAEEPKIIPVEEALSTEITIAAPAQPAKEPAVKSAKRIPEEEMATVTKASRPGRPPKAPRPVPAPEKAAEEKPTDKTEDDKPGHPTACRITDPMPDYLL